MSTDASNRRVVVKSLFGAAGMFAFAIFLLPPMYDLFCEITGLGGKTGDEYTAVDVRVDTSREVRVRFVASNNASMPWVFKPTKDSVVVHPGEPTEITYFAHNITDEDMVSQAIPSLVPNNVADYFHKTECFCFENQPLAAGDQADLKLIFIIDPDLPEGVNSVTLSYTIFDITDRMANPIAQLQ
jgi:cytochrome c oxidase assembly protein subunit 11